MHTGKKISLLRKLKGFTQDDLAEKINKTRALVSHIEQTGKVNHYTLQTILKALKIQAEEFDSFKGNITIAQEDAAGYGSKEIAAIKQKSENYQKENEMLKELVLSQKKIIEMLEAKGGKKEK